MEQPKKTQEAVRYRMGSNERYCSVCVMYRPPKSCTNVSGSISPMGVCDLFVRQAGSSNA